ncbi:hypothetical protein Htur_5268 (plasmid) [Haloterrigena turkmenica DSM 5511]|uniref:Phage protein n=1 Tax=Haloterrigena turkmenica (strain ATCC 51198 / DSM 5511 / JCM 9101 / NCIMB 13204 / VKM B-1734 / 4k) TaxID=543526 RepID=D2S3P9_HALTV|nr:hypothetical protein [Haloterrigena turkmenica]ADB63996.1 hypothetical protein Htur_5268 [Haloterrigena turkmenica DSM 5511]
MTLETSNPDEVDELLEEQNKLSNDIDRELKRYIDENPVFRREFELFDEPGFDRPYIQSVAFNRWTNNPDQAISTEWQAAVIYGYKQALNDIVSELPTHLEESGE